MSYIQSLRVPPEPLTPPQRWLLLVLSILVALTRLLAISRTLHEWDEALFVRGIREYDVFEHRPHAPGYPLFMLAANTASYLIRSEFRAVQAVVVLAAMLIFPTAFYFARELRLSYGAALIGATFTAFLPTVWYYGGTGLSDVPALVAILGAAAFLLRGGRNPGAYILGALLLAVAAGIRPQIVLVAMPPALAGAMACRSLRTVAAAALTVLVATAAAYGGAAYFTIDPPNGFVKSVRSQGQYVREVDSYANPGRPPLRDLASEMLLKPVEAGRSGNALVALAILGTFACLMRSRGALLILLTMFIPTALLTWTMLDMTAIGRYSIAYAPMYSLLAAAGVDALARAVPWRWLQGAIGTALAVSVTAGLTQWAWPALRMAATTDSPPVTAFRALRSEVPSGGARIYVQSGLAQHAHAELYGIPFETSDDPLELADTAFRAGNIFVTSGATTQRNSRVYWRERGRLWQIARARFFEASVIPLDSMIRFTEGWWGDEYAGEKAWRWMGRESRALVPIVDGKGELDMIFSVPLDAFPRAPNITVSWNGEVIGRIQATTPELRLRYVLSSRARGANELQIVSDSTVNPKERGQSEDSRHLALMLHSYRWSPVESTSK